MTKRFFFIFFLIIILLWPLRLLNAQILYVGANYHPHDNKNLEKIKADIGLMKAAGFRVVRIGHLAWDSYEPSEGKFDFAWCDKVMDLLDQAGIKVIFDIAIRPAPIWLHQKFPSLDVVDANGNRHYPNHRYMVDIGDKNYQKYAIRYADSISRHFGKHPALLAFGIDNESGDGPISYSENVKQRFIDWLKGKYSSVDNLNKAWAGQRWSRQITNFEEVGIPVAAHLNDVPERMLDFRSFISDEVNQLLLKVIDKVKFNAPNALINTNAWYYSPLKYFDYSKIAYSGKMSREGCGFYPGSSLTTNWGIMNAAFGISRIQFESSNPFWCSEFTTMTAVPNAIRKQAYVSLMYENQMVCGWTWQSMLSGEEQYLQGMLDWDGLPNRKYDEYKKIASEFKKIEKFFPYKNRAEIALAFSFPSQIASNAFPEQHDSQLQACWDLFYYRNMDTRVVDIRQSHLSYKLLFVPGVAVMDNVSANKIREFVKDGGMVIMTANSAILDETGQVFGTTHPGGLNDVFGIRVAGFEETENLNEISRKSFKGKRLEITYNGKSYETESSRFEIIEPRSSKTLAFITSLDKDYPIITANKYGKGTAIYVGLPARVETLNNLVDELISELGLKKGPDVPLGVLARQIDQKHFLFLNTGNQPQMIKVKGKSYSLLYDKEYSENVVIPSNEPDFIEIK